MARSPAIITLALSAAAAMVQVADASAADLLLVERPGQLTILDRYQQTMPVPERRRLTPFAPMLVRNASATLGDGVTPCMVIELAGAPAYLIMEEGGGLAGRDQAGFIRLVRDVTLSTDTVEVQRPLQMSSPDRRSVRRLTAGDHLAVLFRVDGESYVRRLGGGFGWISAANPAWRTLHRGTAVPPATRHRELELIRSSLNGANVTLASLFSRLGLDRSYPAGPPRWELAEEPDAVICRLTGFTPGGETGFAETTEMLARELQTVLLGRAMGVTSRPGRITIRYLNGAQETD